MKKKKYIANRFDIRRIQNELCNREIIVNFLIILEWTCPQYYCMTSQRKLWLNSFKSHTNDYLIYKHANQMWRKMHCIVLLKAIKCTKRIIAYLLNQCNVIKWTDNKSVVVIDCLRLKLNSNFDYSLKCSTVVLNNPIYLVNSWFSKQCSVLISNAKECFLSEKKSLTLPNSWV